VNGPAGEFLVIDGHQHVGHSDGFVEDVQLRGSRSDDGAYDRNADLKMRCAQLDASGTAQAILVPVHAYFRPRGIEDTRAVNAALAEYRALAPERFPAMYGVVEPAYGPEGLGEVSRLRELGFAGVSFHVRFQGVTAASPAMFDYVAEVCAQGLVPLMHVVPEVTDESLWRVEQVATAFPGTTFLAVDVFGSKEAAREVIAVARRTPNIVFDTSLAHDVGPILAFARAMGTDRLAYGTDQYSLRGPRSDHVLRGIVESSQLNDADKAAILRGNTQRLLGLEPSS
jgi:uncharacterized protein